MTKDEAAKRLSEGATLIDVDGAIWTQGADGVFRVKWPRGRIHEFLAFREPDETDEPFQVMP